MIIVYILPLTRNEDNSKGNNMGYNSSYWITPANQLKVKNEAQN